MNLVVDSPCNDTLGKPMVTIAGGHYSESSAVELYKQLGEILVKRNLVCSYCSIDRMCDCCEVA
jgi:hypothetical protein